MAGLKQRDRQPELMDDPRLDEAVHRGALAALRRVNPDQPQCGDRVEADPAVGLRAARAAA